MKSCILYQNSSSTIILIDIPNSIELAQGDIQNSRRLISSAPPQKQFPSQEPISAAARSRLPETTLAELLLQKYLQIALGQLKQDYHGELHFPRCIEAQDVPLRPTHLTGKGCPDADAKEVNNDLRSVENETCPNLTEGMILPHTDLHFHHESPYFTNVRYEGQNSQTFIPSKSTVLQGSIADTRQIFSERAPLFSLVVLDPPWPNRSASRKKGYRISQKTPEIRFLLSSIPLYDHLTDNGIVGIWITNKTVFRDLALEMFAEWNVSLIEEWIWLKITSHGEPVCSLESRWRKPYEILLVGRRGVPTAEVTRRVVFGVPDLHSRKPNLKEAFERVMSTAAGTYNGLEIFARNATTGFWSWGDEALKYQQDEYWTS